MPNWQPNWHDVRWDHGAAEAAVGALRRTADLLDQTAGERERLADAARTEWRGRYREQFEGQFAQVLRRAHELANECRDTANRIVGADHRAYEEQRRRERERERWRDEKEEEEREERRERSD